MPCCSLVAKIYFRRSLFFFFNDILGSLLCISSLKFQFSSCHRLYLTVLNHFKTVCNVTKSPVVINFNNKADCSYRSRIVTVHALFRAHRSKKKVYVPHCCDMYLDHRQDRLRHLANMSLHSQWRGNWHCGSEGGGNGKRYIYKSDYLLPRHLTLLSSSGWKWSENSWKIVHQFRFVVQLYAFLPGTLLVE